MGMYFAYLIKPVDLVIWSSRHLKANGCKIRRYMYLETSKQLPRYDPCGVHGFQARLLLFSSSFEPLPLSASKNF